MFIRLYTFFIVVLLAGHLAASPIHHPRTIRLHHSWWIRYFWPIYYIPHKNHPSPSKPIPTSTVKPGPTNLPITLPSPTYSSIIQPGPTSSSIVQPNPTYSSIIQPGPPSSSIVQPNPTQSSTIQPGPTSSSIVQPSPTASPTMQPPPPSSSTIQVPTSSPTSQPGTTIPFGEIIENCRVAGTVALTFDDGPFEFTSKLLDIFQQNNAKVTLFVNGQNFGSITQHQGVIERAFNEGHQIGSHTFSHAHLPQLSRDQIESEMDRLDDLVAGITGGNRPTYMRAPFFEYSDLVLQTMKELQYHVLDASVDTKDFENNTPQGVSTSVRLLKEGLDQGGTIVLAHDVHQTTVELLAQQMLDEVKKRGLKPVTVGECLGDPKENWYRKQ